MRVRFLKLSDERHVLEIERDGDRPESVACETRSYLIHDLLHYAVECEAGLESGFWGLLARGRTLADMNDRTGKSMAAEGTELLLIEQVVGALSNVTKGGSTEAVLRALQTYAMSRGTTIPAWLTEGLIDAVRDRMRRLVGHWKTTFIGEAMELPWPALNVTLHP